MCTASEQDKENLLYQILQSSEDSEYCSASRSMGAPKSVELEDVVVAYNEKLRSSTCLREIASRDL